MTDETQVAPNAVAPKSRWGVFANTAFSVILIASAMSTIGDAMFDTGSSWLMTSLSPDPLMVSMVQMAITMPMFILTLPAGALADIIDARKLLIVVQVFVAIVAFAFAARDLAQLAYAWACCSPPHFCSASAARWRRPHGNLLRPSWCRPTNSATRSRSTTRVII